MDWRKAQPDRTFVVARTAPAVIRRIRHLVEAAIAEGWSIERLRSEFEARS